MKLTKRQIKLKEIAITQLKIEQNNGDTECAHSNADDYLCELLNELGFQDVIEEYNKIAKWYD